MAKSGRSGLAAIFARNFLCGDAAIGPSSNVRRHARAQRKSSCPPRVADDAHIPAAIERADRGKSDQSRAGSGPQAERGRNRNAHAGIGAGPEANHDSSGLRRTLPAMRSGSRRTSRNLSIGRERPNEVLARRPRRAKRYSRPRDGKFEREDLHCGFIARSCAPFASPDRKRSQRVRFGKNSGNRSAHSITATPSSSR